jgi:teichuronic acid biosynthesis glycosyltransferase TuaG
MIKSLSGSLVSIVCPAYRCSGVIGNCIRSVLNQTHADWELLIAEDCSPDDTRQVVASWAAKDQRIKLIPMSSNSGPAMARNAALQQARGRWIAFLDSDDWWLPQKLERSLAAAEAHGAALVYTS